MKKLIPYFLLIIVVVIVDQMTKSYVFHNFYLGESVPVIKGLFNLTYVKNKGAAFGMGGNFHDWIRYTLFLALPVVACIWITMLMIKSLVESKMVTIAYALILGGAIGNLIDRFSLNFVIDFFDFYWGNAHFATFNVADSAITIAAGLIILDFFINKKEQKAD